MAFPGTGLETIIHSRELGGRNININILSNVPIVRKRKKKQIQKGHSLSYRQHAAKKAVCCNTIFFLFIIF